MCVMVKGEVEYEENIERETQQHNRNQQHLSEKISGIIHESQPFLIQCLTVHFRRLRNMPCIRSLS